MSERSEKITELVTELIATKANEFAYAMPAIESEDEAYKAIEGLLWEFFTDLMEGGKDIFGQ